METLKHFNDSLDYIEGHLDQEIDLGRAAAIACMSKYHFQRIFSLLSGMPIGEYIRNRRLTKAARELASSRTKVIDIAARYGYETPESFSKAFKKAHGISPSEAREGTRPLNAYPRLSFQIQIKGAVGMKYKIVKKEAFKAIGKDISISTENGENMVKIPQFWQEAYETGFEKELSEKAGSLGLLGICLPDENGRMTYAIAAEGDGGRLPEGWGEYSVPAADYAVFEAVGPMPDAIQEVWKSIYSEWFPSTGYKQASGLELEVYPEAGPDREDFRSEIWIPVVRK